MARKIPYLVARSGRYFSRLFVPIELRAIVGKGELREALGPDRTQALRNLPAAIARAQSTLEAARQRLDQDQPKPIKPGKRLTVREMARLHYEAESRHDEIARFSDLPGIIKPSTTNELFADAFISALRKLASGIVSDQERSEGFEQSLIGAAIDRFKEDGHTSVEAGTPEYSDLANALAQAQIEALQRSKERDQGNFDGKPSAAILIDPKPLPGDPLNARILSPDATKSLREILPEFLKGRGIGPSMQNEHHVSCRMFEEFLGEPKPLYKITRQDVRAYMKALQELPANYVKRFPGKTLPEAIKLNNARLKPYDALTPTTINDKWLSRLSALLAWCRRNDMIPDNPAEGVRLDFKRDAKPPRVPFDPGDLARIFAPPLFDRKTPYDETQWALILSLYLGTRPSELAQVRLDSIRHERDVLIIRIEEELKNAGSNRMIPIHSALIGLGFETYVAKLRKAGKSHLFPVWYDQAMTARREAEAKASKSGIPVTLNHHFPKFIPRRFNVTYLPSVGIEDSRKNFYSFRHTFKTGLSLSGVGKDVRDYLTGHVDSSVGATYVHDVSIQTMKEAIEKLSFDGFNL